MFEILCQALQGRYNTEASDIKRVNELGTHDYFGSSDLAKVECWLIDLEQVFAVLRCLDEDIIQLAAFLLKENVYHWWKTIRRGYANSTSITLVEF